MQRSLYLFVVIVAVAAGAGYWFSSSQPAIKQQQVGTITTFEECKQAGYPIMESYPEQCMTPDGRSFINQAQHVNTPPPASSTAPKPASTSAPKPASARSNCVVTGCSKQLCVSKKEAEGLMTTCIYSPEYACYKTATCEMQQDGKCGWTQTTSLKACLQNPPQEKSGSKQAY